jgi:demethoxyubiquinone hydroxylase (CLK1/Coq7/Cat5 family)
MKFLFIRNDSPSLKILQGLRISRQSSGMLRRVALVRNDVSKELSAFIIRVTRIGELGTTLVVTSNRRTLRRNTISSQRASVAHALAQELPDYVTSISHRVHAVE